MQDVNNYQFYDPTPQLPPEPWWKRGRTWKVIGLVVLGLVVLGFVAMIAFNVVQNRRFGTGGTNDAMQQADALTNQMQAECDQADAACLERARADAARATGLVQACDGLENGAQVACVTLIAKDRKDPEVCNALANGDRASCLDLAYLLAANERVDLSLCDKISDRSSQAACRAQVESTIILSNGCAEAGIDESRCTSLATLRAAMESGDPAACEALEDPDDEDSCMDAIQSVDDDEDGLVLADEVARGLSDTVADTDGDGLTDGDEVHQYGTDPAKSDTDGDGFSDSTEVNSGYDPLN